MRRCRGLTLGVVVAATGAAVASAPGGGGGAEPAPPLRTLLRQAPGLATLRPHHVALSVRDLDASARWYERVLGFRPIVRRAFPPIETRAINLERNGLQIELFARRGSRRLAAASGPVSDDLLAQGVKHVGFVVDDLDAALAELGARGVAAVDGPTAAPDLGLRLAFVRDPDGNLIELGEALRP